MGYFKHRRAISRLRRTKRKSKGEYEKIKTFCDICGAPGKDMLLKDYKNISFPTKLRDRIRQESSKAYPEEEYNFFRNLLVEGPLIVSNPRYLCPNCCDNIMRFNRKYVFVKEEQSEKQMDRLLQLGLVEFTKQHTEWVEAFRSRLRSINDFKTSKIQTLELTKEDVGNLLMCTCILVGINYKRTE